MNVANAVKAAAAVPAASAVKAVATAKRWKLKPWYLPNWHLLLQNLPKHQLLLRPPMLAKPPRSAPHVNAAAATVTAATAVLVLKMARRLLKAKLLCKLLHHKSVMSKKHPCALTSPWPPRWLPCRKRLQRQLPRRLSSPFKPPSPWLQQHPPLFK